jgi:hypothetical protein
MAKRSDSTATMLTAGKHSVSVEVHEGELLQYLLFKKGRQLSPPPLRNVPL